MMVFVSAPLGSAPNRFLAGLSALSCALIEVLGSRTLIMNWASGKSESRSLSHVQNAAFFERNIRCLFVP